MTFYVPVGANGPEMDDLIVSLGNRPRNGVASVDPKTYEITYTPRADYHGADTVTYILTDPDHLTDTGEIALTIRSINDAPQFSADPIQLEVAKVAKEGDNVGRPVAATDVEGDSLRYSLSFSPEFEINGRSGQITVKQGATIDPMVDHYSVTVTADDQQPEFNTASVDVTINVVEQLTRPPTTGGGGGGGGPPPVPVPSDADFDWNVTRGIDEPDRDNDIPTRHLVGRRCRLCRG